MMQFFQRLLGKTSAPAPIRGPLGLHLNAGFTLDTLASGYWSRHCWWSYRVKNTLSRQRVA